MSAVAATLSSVGCALLVGEIRRLPSPLARTAQSTEQAAERDAAAAALVQRVLAGDTEAFATIVDRWKGPLVNLAYRFCRDSGMAEELAQDAFLKIFRALGNWRQQSSFSTWLYTVALNHYRSAMRRRPPPTISLEDTSYLAAGDLDQEIDAELRDEAVRRAVATLPPKYRDVIVLFYFHDMDLAQTARTTGLPEGTLKARLFRARKLLRQKISPLLQTQPSRES